MPTRTPIVPSNPHALYKLHGYSPAIRSGDLLFVSGQVGARPDGSPEPDLKAQITLAFANLRDVLKAANCTFDDIVDLTLFFMNPDTVAPLAIEIFNKHFPTDPKPNATAIGVTWLSGFQFEIKAIARVPTSTTTP